MLSKVVLLSNVPHRHSVTQAVTQAVTQTSAAVRSGPPKTPAPSLLSCRGPGASPPHPRIPVTAATLAATVKTQTGTTLGPTSLRVFYLANEAHFHGR